MDKLECTLFWERDTLLIGLINILNHCYGLLFFMISLNKLKKFKVKTFSKSSGELIPLSFKKQFKIDAKRIFFIYGKKNKIRGEHAHKKCSQLFFPVLGKMVLDIKTPKIKKKIILSHSSKEAILVPPKYWCSVKFLQNKSIVMVVCDQYYNFNDYLETFNDYKKYLKIK